MIVFYFQVPIYYKIVWGTNVQNVSKKGKKNRIFDKQLKQFMINVTELGHMTWFYRLMMALAKINKLPLSPTFRVTSVQHKKVLSTVEPGFLQYWRVFLTQIF